MIDIHCHILPGFDDGAQSEEASLAMCVKAASDGIKTIVATPHTGNGVYSNPAKEVISGVKKLNKRLKEESIDISILPGHDAHIEPNIIENILSGEVLTVNNAGKYVLLEMPAQSVPFYVEGIITDLIAKDIIPIITHPERNYQVQKDMQKIKKFVELGAMVQITALSLTGGFGELARNTAILMIENKIAHIIASDAHSENKRLPVLSEAVSVAVAIIGEEAKKMVTETPSKIISVNP